MIYGPYAGQVVEVHDGDTIYINLSVDYDPGFDLRIKAIIFARVRVMGINSPELSTPEGKRAAAFAKEILPVGTLVSVKSFKWDKFGGRVDGEIKYGPDYSLSFAQTMIASGHAKEYHV